MIIRKNKKFRKNIFYVLKEVLKSLSIQYTDSYLEHKLAEFPMPGHVNAISYALKEYNIDSLVVSLDYKQLIGIELYTILYLKENDHSYFGILIEALPEQIIYFVPHKGVITQSADQLNWGGICLVLEHDNKIRAEIGLKRKIFLKALLPAILFISFWGTGCFIFERSANSVPDNSGTQLLFLILIMIKYSAIIYSWHFLSTLEDVLTTRLQDDGFKARFNKTPRANSLLTFLMAYYYVTSLIMLLFTNDVQQLLSYTLGSATIFAICFNGAMLHFFIKYQEYTKKLLGLLLVPVIELITVFVCSTFIYTYRPSMMFSLFSAIWLLIGLIFSVCLQGAIPHFRQLIWHSDDKHRSLNRLNMLNEFLSDNNEPMFLARPTLIPLTTEGQTEIVLILSPYGLRSEELFKTAAPFFCDCKISVCFTGNLKDAMYCQFATFITSAAIRTDPKIVADNLSWWYDQRNKDFDNFKNKFTKVDLSDRSLVSQWNKWTRDNNLACPGIVIDQKVIPPCFKIEDIESLLINLEKNGAVST